MANGEDNKDVIKNEGRQPLWCLYSASFSEFYDDTQSILGKLCGEYHGELNDNQKGAWRSEIEIMKNALSKYKDDSGEIIFEYNIPRLGKRIDVVLLLKGIIFCLEFKVGESQINEMDIDQVLDYALDLKNFHQLSQKHTIVPILIATKYKEGTTPEIQLSRYDDGVVNPLFCGEKMISQLLGIVLETFENEPPIDPNWKISPYNPTPTIIEAARTLYENHSVEDINLNFSNFIHSKIGGNFTLPFALSLLPFPFFLQCHS